MGKLEILPCYILFDGTVPLEKFFKPQETEISEIDHNASNNVENCRPDYMNATFRGRRLYGSKIDLKSMKYKAGFLRLSGDSMTNNKLECVSNVESFRYWNHDNKPNKMDDIPQWFTIVNYENLIHQNTF
ncbi:hypothetical protein cand_020460 [Cryptosporidium andersoni]|uniref:Uncharacterized protein n=1 Tax=Cryptosporidium andersoni TaxID=117008 RepID=A0A1J4MSQ8_9CRYT|nr:hypothetical protein cand_020460 [Cryptosporidium andersoni]